MTPAHAAVEIGNGAGGGALVMFWIFAVLAVAGAVATVTRKGAVVAVVCLVGTFFSLAVEFLLLYAQFLAVIQVLVYAGAIMVLFVFVVMVVSRGEPDPLWRVSGPITKLLALAGLAMILWRGWYALRSVPPGFPEPPPASFGTVAGVGGVLLGEFLFAFEAISILLLVAVVGALVVGRQHHHRESEREAAP